MKNIGLKWRKRDEQQHRNDVNRQMLNAINGTNFKNVINALQKNHVKTVAIYGAGVVGTALGVVLLRYGIDVEYYIDKFSDKKVMNGKPIKHVVIDYLDNTDAVIITPYYEKESIRNELINYFPFECKILYLDEMLGVVV